MMAEAPIMDSSLPRVCVNRATCNLVQLLLGSLEFPGASMPRASRGACLSTPPHTDHPQVSRFNPHHSKPKLPELLGWSNESTESA
jgi:hypothetical protein